MPLPLVSVVAAVQADGGIGAAGGLPWRLPADLKRFARVTTHVPAAGLTNAVVMGAATWRSLPAAYKPLPKRLNVVISSKPRDEWSDLPAEVLLFPSLPAAVEALAARPGVYRTFVIGGARLFSEAVAAVPGATPAPSFLCDSVYLTAVTGIPAACDVSCPALTTLDDDAYALVDWSAPFTTDAGVTYTFKTYRSRTLHRLPRSSTPTYLSSGAKTAPGVPPEPDMAPLPSPASDGEPYLSPYALSLTSHPPPPHDETQYLSAIRDIITTGIARGDRTGTGTLAKFGLTMRYNLADDTLPLLTTKRVFWRGVAEELLWFISGDTSAATLQAKNIHIWDGNGSKEFLTKCGLGHREEGDLGPVYGFQWRHFGAPYVDMHADYSGKGVDQLAGVIDKLRNNPTDRRIILTAWNPAALAEMALPPCHMLAQFFVSDDRRLTCLMYQRSADMGLGVPFNVASYALLTRLLAQVCGLTAGELVHVLGDAHVYANHVEALRTQLEREPRPFPKLRIDPSITSIDDFKFEHFTVEGYDPHPPIKMDMAV